MTGINVSSTIYRDAINEEVNYQNPLLFLKIWEIYTESKQPDFIEKVQWHYHKEVEFLAIIEGTLGVQSKKGYSQLGPGDVMVLGASQPHRSHKALPPSLKYIVFQVDLVKHFDQSTMPYLHGFSELTEPLDCLNYIFDTCQKAKQQLYHLILEVFNESQAQRKGYEISISSLVKQMILLLLRHDTKNVLNYNEENEFDTQRLKPVLEYIEQHLADKIFVEDASKMLNLSYHYFIKYFKKTMGVSFLDYINFKRVKKAELLLLTSELSIMEISFEVGISNIAHFYKLFKRYNECSPKEYRHKFREDK